jgi:hypothetical protein
VGELLKHLAADSAVRGKQAYALSIHFLQRGADPAKLEAFLSGLGATNAAKIIEGAKRAIQFRRTRECAGTISPDLIAATAAELGTTIEPSFTMHVGEAIRRVPIPKTIVAGLFARNTLGFVMGEPGACKTFWMVSLSAAIASGEPRWMERSIHPDLRGGTIVYALAEGAGMFQIRLIGALQHLARRHDVEIPDSFIFTKESLRLEDAASIERFLAAAERYSPCMIVVDTYQRHGGPETEEERVSKAIEHLTLIKEELGCTVVGVHHLPKDGRQTPRGHGAIDGSIDTAVYLTKSESNVITARCEQRDLEESSIYSQTKILMVEGYVNDETGDPLTTLVLEPCKAQAVQTQVRRASKQDGLSAAILAAVTLTPGLNQNELCKAVGGKKAAAIAEIARLVGTGQLSFTQNPAKAGKTEKCFTLGPVNF